MAKKRRKRRRTTSRSHEELLSKLREQAPMDQQEAPLQPEESQEMSGVIEEFMESFTEASETYKGQRVLLMFACMAWNLSMFPDDAMEPEIEKVVNRMSDSGVNGEGVRRVLEEMIKRKRKHFAHDTRPIKDYKLTETEDGFHISATSFVGIGEYL